MSPVPPSLTNYGLALTAASVAGSIQKREVHSPRISSTMLLTADNQHINVVAPSTSLRCGVSVTPSHEKTGSLLRASSRGRFPFSPFTKHIYFLMLDGTIRLRIILFVIFYLFFTFEHPNIAFFLISYLSFPVLIG